MNVEIEREAGPVMTRRSCEADICVIGAGSAGLRVAPARASWVPRRC